MNRPKTVSPIVLVRSFGAVLMMNSGTATPTTVKKIRMARPRASPFGLTIASRACLSRATSSSRSSSCYCDRSSWAFRASRRMPRCNISVSDRLAQVTIGGRRLNPTPGKLGLPTGGAVSTANLISHASSILI